MERKNKDIPICRSGIGRRMRGCWKSNILEQMKEQTLQQSPNFSGVSVLSGGICHTSP